MQVQSNFSFRTAWRTRRVLEAVRRFKNERFPSVAVTVDLLTTGIDVPEITALVFLRPVGSRILFEQMLGRATRLCPEIGKTHFEIYDPVGVYDSLGPVSEMRPVAADPAVSFAALLEGLELLTEAGPIRAHAARILAKLQRARRGLDDKAASHFAALSGGASPADAAQAVAQALRGADAVAAKSRLLALADALRFLDSVPGRGRRPLVISEAKDELLAHERGYGASGDRHQDYLDAFADYVKTHVNDIAALNIVCTRPKDLDREGFNALRLNTVLAQTTNREIAADIICLIRRYTRGSPLLDHKKRGDRAVAWLKKTRDSPDRN